MSNEAAGQGDTQERTRVSPIKKGQKRESHEKTKYPEREAKTHGEPLLKLWGDGNSMVERRASESVEFYSLSF